jgi:hypothetical protein
MDGDVGRRPERAEYQKHVLLFNELSDLFNSLRRAVAVVTDDELILRPFIPPCSLSMLKYAASVLPMMP